MPNGRAFDELGAILESRGEVTAARQVEGGAAGGLLLAFILGRFTRLLPAEAEIIADIAERGVAAASIIRRQPGDTIPDLGPIPINRFLGGDDPGGMRVLWKVIVFDEDGEPIIDVFIPGTGTESIDEIEAEARALAEERVKAYPGQFRDVDPSTIGGGATKISFTERRF